MSELLENFISWTRKEKGLKHFHVLLSVSNECMTVQQAFNTIGKNHPEYMLREIERLYDAFMDGYKSPQQLWDEEEDEEDDEEEDEEDEDEDEDYEEDDDEEEDEDEEENEDEDEEEEEEEDEEEKDEDDKDKKECIIQVE